MVKEMSELDFNPYPAEDYYKNLIKKGEEAAMSANEGRFFHCVRGAETVEQAQAIRCPLSCKRKGCTECCGGGSVEKCNDPSICTKICASSTPQTMPGKFSGAECLMARVMSRA